MNLTCNSKIIYLWVFFFSFLRKFVYGYVLKTRNLTIFVNSIDFLPLISILRKNEIIAAKSLLDIVAVDMLNISKNGRFLLSYIFWNYTAEVRIILRIFNDGRKPMKSVMSLYKSSDWLEREVWDMYGIKFLFHGNLRRILTDYGYKGYPLRKDFPLIGYIDIYYDEVLQNIALNAVEITQAFRYYEFENPWNNWKY